MGSKKRAEPWERQPGESDKAYAAFKIYLDMGAQRSLVKAGQSLGKTRYMMEDWSVRYNWRQRVGAWEADQDQQWLEERRHVAREAARRHTTLARALTTKVASKLREIDTAELSPADLARWLDVAVKIERLSLGMSTANVSGTGQGGQIEHTHSIAIQQAERSLSSYLGLDLAPGSTGGLVPKP